MTELQYWILFILGISLFRFFLTLYRAKNITFGNFEEIERDIAYYGGAISATLIILVISFLF